MNFFEWVCRILNRVLTKLMVLTELMGLMKLIDGFDEILADPDLKKMDPKLLWYTIAHPSLAWEEENFV